MKIFLLFIFYLIFSSFIRHLSIGTSDFELWKDVEGYKFNDNNTKGCHGVFQSLQSLPKEN